MNLILLSVVMFFLVMFVSGLFGFVGGLWGFYDSYALNKTAELSDNPNEFKATSRHSLQVAVWMTPISALLGVIGYLGIHYMSMLTPYFVS